VHGRGSVQECAHRMPNNRKGSFIKSL
jgi:hypothetical protein